MKNVFSKSAMLLAMSALLFASCKKEINSATEPMQNDEAVVLIVVTADIAGDLVPIFGSHVRRVKQRVILMNLHIGHQVAFELWHGHNLFCQISGRRGIAF